MVSLQSRSKKTSNKVRSKERPKKTGKGPKSKKKTEERWNQELLQSIDCPKCGTRMVVYITCPKCHFSPQTAYVSRREAKEFTHPG